MTKKLNAGLPPEKRGISSFRDHVGMMQIDSSFGVKFLVHTILLFSDSGENVCRGKTFILKYVVRSNLN